jgi:hypothetical protein
MSGDRMLLEGGIMALGMVATVCIANPCRPGFGSSLLVTIVSMLARTIWFLLLGHERRVSDDTFKRTTVSWLIDAGVLPLFFLGFLRIAMEWGLLWASLRGQDSARRVIYIVSWLLMLFVCGTAIAMVVLILLFPDSREYSEPGLVRAIPTILNNSIFLLVGFGLAWQGRTFHVFFEETPDTREKRRAARTLRRIVGLSAVCALMFLLRALAQLHGMLVYDMEVLPKTAMQETINEILFPTMYYTLPELIPSVVLVLVLAPNKNLRMFEGVTYLPASTSRELGTTFYSTENRETRTQESQS